MTGFGADEGARSPSGTWSESVLIVRGAEVAIEAGGGKSKIFDFEAI